MKKLKGNPVCRKCNYLIDGATGVNNNESPKKDDISICVNCATIGKFDKDFNLIPLTPKEFSQIAEEDPETFKMIKEIKLDIVIKKISSGEWSCKILFPKYESISFSNN